MHDVILGILPEISMSTSGPKFDMSGKNSRKLVPRIEKRVFVWRNLSKDFHHCISIVFSWHLLKHPHTNN